MLKPGTPFLAMMAIVLCWGLAFSLACRLMESTAVRGSASDSIIGRFLGASRLAISRRLYVEADNFFHAGVKHIQQSAFDDVFQRAKAVISPQLHKHTEGTGIYEVMPWLEFAVAMDPHNVEVYLTTAYWLSGPGDRPDLAEKVLFDAQRNNPSDYRVLLEKGQLYIKEHKEEFAARALDAGLKLWPSGLDLQDEQTTLDLGRMLTLRAFLYEVSGDRDRALSLSKKALAYFPGNRALKRRVDSLLAGEDHREQARALWESVFPRVSQCAREGHDHDHDHDQDHHE